jgi:hypothetical protein
MRSTSVALHAADVPEWDVAELEQAQLGPGAEPADPEQVKRILNHVDLRLPTALGEGPLHEAPTHETPLHVPLTGPAGAAYHLLAVPLTIIVPDDLRMTRLRMTLEFLAEGGGAEAVVAQDLAPTAETVETVHDYGEVSLDVSKALTFVFPPAADALGLKLTFPLRWTSDYPVVQASGPMSNPVIWQVADEAMHEGFIGYVITRSAPGEPFRVRAQIAAELRNAFLGKLRRARFTSDAREYTVAAA